MTISQTIRLNSGVTIPRVGLGVWQAARGAETRNAVRDALRLGYRHVDTAKVYGNEEDVGAAVRESGIPRNEIFITTKLWNSDQGYDAALNACEASLTRLGLDFVDLYLVHWPVEGRRKDSWRALEKLLADGRARAIGVSNYMVHHLDELVGYAKVLPAVDQIEVTPFFQQLGVRARCEKLGIVIEAYSPLTRGKRLKDPALAEIAKEVRRSPAQVLLRWGLQHGMVVLPKSTHAERIAENAAIFDFTLSAGQMTRLDALEEGMVTGWDPREAP